MGAIERVGPVYRLFVATAASAISAIAYDSLSHLFESRLLALAALLVVISLLVLVLSELLEQVIERSVTVRRLLEGDDFIEGFWYDVTIDSPSLRVVHGVLYRIGYKDGGLVIGGVTYDLRGERIATYNSESAVFSNRRLSFEYRSTNDELDQVVETGFTQVQFDAPPQSYSGFYFDYTAQIHAKVHGYKVVPSTLKKFGGFATTDSKRDFMVSLLAARQAELDARKAAAPAAAPGA